MSLNERILNELSTRLVQNTQFWMECAGLEPEAAFSKALAKTSSGPTTIRAAREALGLPV